MNAPSADEIIELAYAAAFDATRWREVLVALQGRYKLGASTLVGFAPDSDRVQFFLDNDLPKDAWGSYSAYYYKVDTRLHQLHRAALNEPVVDHHFLTDAEIDGSEFHQDFLRPYDLRWTATMKVGDTAESLTAVTLMRPDRAGAFTEADLVDLRRVVPHLGRATRIARSLGWAELRQSVEQNLVDRLPVGIVVVDSAARPILMNAVARRLVAAQDGILLALGRLRAAHADDDAPLQRMLSAALLRPLRIAVAEQASTLRRASGARALSAMASPAGADPQALPFGPGAAAILVLIDPEHSPPVSAALLRRSFGLTRAEAALALALLAGDSLADFAERTEIAVATARTHLNAIFRKTDTSRQGELVALLSRFAVFGGLLG